LQQQLEESHTQIATLQLTVLQLQEQLARARKDSSTSSKPPSSDIVQPPKSPPPQGQDKRRQGGQPGHAQHLRTPLPAEQLNGGIHDSRLNCCPDCGHNLQPADAPTRAVQQLDIPVLPAVQTTEYRSQPGWCPRCRQVHYAPLPGGVQQGGLVGPHLTTWIAYLKGACHASFSTVRKFLRDILHVNISRGQLAKIIGKVSQALAAPYDELLQALPSQAWVNTDETGHKDQGQRHWTWCFRAPLYTLFRIDPSRSADVLLAVLGQEFDGVLGCDFFSAYRRYLRECGVVVQFCLAHLIRDVKFLTTLPDERDRAYGERIREALRGLFAVIHQREQLDEATFQTRLQAAKAAVLTQASEAVPQTRHSAVLAKRFAQYGEGYFAFITMPQVGPTNNLAEQAIRFVVLDRYVTQGTRGDTGQRWSERIWTVIATCTQQGRSVFDYLQEAVSAWFEGTAAPSLRTLPTN
jgi:transposase